MKQFTITLLLTLLPLMASADRVCVDDIYYNIDTATKQAEVTKKPSGYYSGVIVLTKKFTYDHTEYNVTTIGYQAFSYCSRLTSITIPNSVTAIESEAFSGCI